MTDSIKQKDFKLPGVIYIALCIIYMEVLVKLFTHNTFFNIGLLFMPIFSFATSFIIYGFSFLFKEKNRRLFVGGCICLLLVLFATQTIYHRFFNRYLIVYSITGGGIGQVLSGDIARNTLSAVLISTPLVLALAVPTVITFIFYDKITVCKVPNKKWYIYLVPTVILHITALSVISLIPSTSVIHSGLFDPNHSIESFGVLYTEVLDIKGSREIQCCALCGIFTSNGKLLFTTTSK